jgi:hypothetical protein
VIVDDVQDYFETGAVKLRNHLLEFTKAVDDVGRAARIGREEADGVIAPVVR